MSDQLSENKVQEVVHGAETLSSRDDPTPPTPSVRIDGEVEPSADLDDVTPASDYGNDPLKSPNRGYARQTFEVVSAKAVNITSSIKSSSKVIKTGIEVAEKLLQPAKYTWNSYGDSLLNSLDDKIDYALDAVELAAQKREREQRLQKARNASYIVHWNSIKHKFVKTRWFATVDEILLEKEHVQLPEGSNLRPAEVFFDTTTEVYLTDGGSYDEFLAELKHRMGPAWDDRLEPPAATFYTTSQYVKTAVGAGRFFGGAYQLGKQKLSSVVDDLMSRWDSVLGATDDYLDDVLPSLEDESADEEEIMDALQFDMDEEDAEVGEDVDEDEDDDDVDSDTIFRMDVEGPRADDECRTGSLQVSEDEDGGLEEEMAVLERKSTGDGSFSPSSTKRNHVVPLAQKYTKRIKQRLPLVRELPAALKSRLMESAWFSQVDGILAENAIVQMMQAQMRAVMSTVTRPAEHFYNTSVETFRMSTKSSQGFVSALKRKMGSAWDERLTSFAESFYQTASNNNTECKEQ